MILKLAFGLIPQCYQNATFHHGNVVSRIASDILMAENSPALTRAVVWDLPCTKPDQASYIGPSASHRLHSLRFHLVLAKVINVLLLTLAIPARSMNLLTMNTHNHLPESAT